ncbi:hypothetical protein IJ182_11240 [bacterium]|nr:hypothetical protein [bacterium]
MINNNFHNISFGSNYRYDVTSDNLSQSAKIENQIYHKAGNKVSFFADYTPFEESVKTGVFEKVHISAPDEYDDFIESVLKQRNINFVKQTKQETLNLDNIYSRIILSDVRPNNILVSLDTKKVDELLKQEKDFYIAPNGTSGTISDRYEGVKQYLLTGRDIHATELYLRENNGQLSATIGDGRHRFAVMRDMGMPKIKISLNKESLFLAQKYGLVK